jgi:hypothetical protein
MKTTIQINERRKDTRFKVQGMVIAMSHPPFLPPGNIKEISRSGLVFQYRENGNNRAIPQELDIIWADYVAKHHLEKIPVRIVSDVLDENGGKDNESVTRRQAVAFEKLTPRQENQIGRLIKARGTIPL